ncbi:hypothetical protein HY605_04370 [Candidatus Peregrinibacteria bacterium]|nr:hypothetical protein [Candidatus Peregrinibacteria bacterium]
MRTIKFVKESRRWKWWLINLVIFIVALVVLYARARDIIRVWIFIVLIIMQLCYTVRLLRISRLNRFDWIGLKIFPVLGVALLIEVLSVSIPHSSCSMHHDDKDFDKWWEKHWLAYYPDITKERFARFPFPNGIDSIGYFTLTVIQKKPQIGDIVIAYMPERKALVAHRVINKEVVDGKVFYKTKGDNNLIPDQPVEESQVQSVVMPAPLYAFMALFFKEPDCRIDNNLK